MSSYLSYLRELHKQLIPIGFMEQTCYQAMIASCTDIVCFIRKYSRTCAHMFSRVFLTYVYEVKLVFIYMSTQCTDTFDIVHHFNVA